mmetsp:Transcript_27933/g.69014  ORF Transcript_27933/g.69014 Transcript_27933/m.69014 type:complete len:265 (+) Transcript_27933:3-797(+)
MGHCERHQAAQTTEDINYRNALKLTARGRWRRAAPRRVRCNTGSVCLLWPTSRRCSPDDAARQRPCTPPVPLAHSEAQGTTASLRTAQDETTVVSGGLSRTPRPPIATMPHPSTFDPRPRSARRVAAPDHVRRKLSRRFCSSASKSSPPASPPPPAIATPAASPVVPAPPALCIAIGALPGVAILLPTSTPSSASIPPSRLSSSSSSSSSANASSIASSIISSFMPIISFCFSNSIMIFCICGRFIFLFIVPITLTTPFIDCAI